MQDTHDAKKPNERGYIPAGQFILGLFVLGFCVYGFTHHRLLGATLSTTSIQETIGGAIPFALFPSLVIVPWRLIQRRSGRFTNAPLVAGGILAILILCVLATNVLRLLKAAA